MYYIGANFITFICGVHSLVLNSKDKTSELIMCADTNGYIPNISSVGNSPFYFCHFEFLGEENYISTYFSDPSVCVSVCDHVHQLVTPLF